MEPTTKFNQNRDLYLPVLAQAFANRGLPPELGPALARQESAFDPGAETLTGGDAARGGSYGLCQMSLETARALGYKGTAQGLKDPYVNAALAAELCWENSKRSEDIRDVIAMYNSGKLFKSCPIRTANFYVPSVEAYLKLYAPLCQQWANLPAPALSASAADISRKP